MRMRLQSVMLLVILMAVVTWSMELRGCSVVGKMQSCCLAAAAAANDTAAAAAAAAAAAIYCTPLAHTH